MPDELDGFNFERARPVGLRPLYRAPVGEPAPRGVPPAPAASAEGQRQARVMAEPYRERRRQLEALNLNDAYWRTPDAFDDGDALFEATCERELEGIVAKLVDGRYRPGERGWVKIKNRAYWRYEMERESAIAKRRQRMFV